MFYTKVDTTIVAQAIWKGFIMAISCVGYATFIGDKNEEIEFDRHGKFMKISHELADSIIANCKNKPLLLSHDSKLPIGKVIDFYKEDVIFNSQLNPALKCRFKITSPKFIRLMKQNAKHFYDVQKNPPGYISTDNFLPRSDYNSDREINIRDILMNYYPGLSIAHNKDNLQVEELSLCIAGARDGTVLENATFDADDSEFQNFDDDAIDCNYLIHSMAAVPVIANYHAIKKLVESDFVHLNQNLPHSFPDEKIITTLCEAYSYMFDNHKMSVIPESESNRTKPTKDQSIEMVTTTENINSNSLKKDNLNHQHIENIDVDQHGFEMCENSTETTLEYNSTSDSLKKDNLDQHIDNTNVDKHDSEMYKNTTETILEYDSINAKPIPSLNKHTNLKNASVRNNLISTKRKLDNLFDKSANMSSSVQDITQANSEKLNQLLRLLKTKTKKKIKRKYQLSSDSAESSSSDENKVSLKSRKRMRHRYSYDCSCHNRRSRVCEKNCGCHSQHVTKCHPSPDVYSAPQNAVQTAGNIPQNAVHKYYYVPYNPVKTKSESSEVTSPPIHEQSTTSLQDNAKEITGDMFDSWVSKYSDRENN